MLHAVKVKPDVYWVGGIDWNERKLPRIHDGSRFHVQRLPYHGRAGDPYRYLQTGFRRRTYRAYQRGGRSGPVSSTSSSTT